MNFNYESFDDAHDHPDQKVNRNLMLFNREFLMLRNQCSKIGRKQYFPIDHVIMFSQIYVPTILLANFLVKINFLSP